MKIDVNVNSIKVNPLVITKPTYKNSAIEDIYLVRGKDEYIYGKGYIENYDVIVVKRFTPDLVRKFTYSFNSRSQAMEFMHSLYDIDDVQAHLSDLELIGDNDITVDEKSIEKSENKKSVLKTFSFGYDDEINYRSDNSCRKNSIKQEKSVRKDSSIF